VQKIVHRANVKAPVDIVTIGYGDIPLLHEEKCEKRISDGYPAFSLLQSHYRREKVSGRTLSGKVGPAILPLLSQRCQRPALKSTAA